jgi:hypothetical protein
METPAVLGLVEHSESLGSDQFQPLPHLRYAHAIVTRKHGGLEPAGIGAPSALVIGLRDEADE